MLNHEQRELPLNIETYLLKFIKVSGFDTGSIDMIKSTDGNYYFLEINPVGIFSNISFCCNYYLEKEIINLLSGNKNEN